MYPSHWEFEDKEKSGRKIRTTIVCNSSSALRAHCRLRLRWCQNRRHSSRNWIPEYLNTSTILRREYKVNGNIYYVLWGGAVLELDAILYASVVTLCLVWFLHCFEPVQCRSTRHLNEYSNRSSLTLRCLRSCFLVRNISVFIRKFLKNFCLTNSEICTNNCKM